MGYVTVYMQSMGYGIRQFNINVARLEFITYISNKTQL